MHVIMRTAVAVGLVCTIGVSASAQDAGDAAGWFGMMFTPYGALPPLVTPAMAGAASSTERAPLSFDLRYGHWDFGGGEEPFNTFGLAARVRNFSFIGGYEKCEGCSDGIFMAGVELETDLTTAPIGAPSSTSTLIVGVRPGLGYARPNGGEGHAFSATIDLPLSVSVPLSSAARIVPFVVPGMGFGGFEDTDETFSDGESGFRPSIGAGIGLLMTNGFGLHLGWRQVILEDAPSILGLGASITR